MLSPRGGWRTSVVRLFSSPRRQRLPSEEEVARPMPPSDALLSSSSDGTSIVTVIIPPLQQHARGGAAQPCQYDDDRPCRAGQLLAPRP
jgi:hypothetical protein